MKARRESNSHPAMQKEDLVVSPGWRPEGRATHLLQCRERPLLSAQDEGQKG